MTDKLKLYLHIFRTYFELLAKMLCLVKKKTRKKNNNKMKKMENKKKKHREIYGKMTWRAN